MNKIQWLPLRNLQSGGKAISCNVKQSDKKYYSGRVSKILWKGEAGGDYFQLAGSGKATWRGGFEWK